MSEKLQEKIFTLKSAKSVSREKKTFINVSASLLLLLLESFSTEVLKYSDWPPKGMKGRERVGSWWFNPELLLTAHQSVREQKH